MAVMENKAVSTETEKAEQQPQTGGAVPEGGKLQIKPKAYHYLSDTVTGVYICICSSGVYMPVYKEKIKGRSGA